MPAPEANPRSARNEQLEAADVALRRGDHATAAQLLSPLAAAGVTRAQLMLGRVREAASGRVHSDFQAYVWYGVAARAGEPGAQALRDQVAPRLQPAEIQQADQAIERFRARPEAAATGSP
jgi:TPR repeat protein